MNGGVWQESYLNRAAIIEAHDAANYFQVSHLMLIYCADYKVYHEIELP